MTITRTAQAFTKRQNGDFKNADIIAPMDVALADASASFVPALFNANLSLWRALIDASTQTLRLQQSAWLDALKGAFTAGADLGPEQDIIASEYAATSELDSVVSAYERIGSAWFEAYRKAGGSVVEATAVAATEDCAQK